MFMFLASVYTIGLLTGSHVEINVEKWRAAHPYQAEKAPANPAQVTGGSTSENPE